MSVADRQWALVLGASVGTGASICEEIAHNPGMNVIGFHRGHYQEDAGALVDGIKEKGGHMVMCEANAGEPEALAECIAMVKEHVPSGGLKLFVHSLSGASIGHFLKYDNVPDEDQLSVRKIEKTFNYLAHSFPYWTRALYEADLLAPSSRMIGLTNALEHQMLHNCGAIGAAKAALEQYVRYMSAELGQYGHRVNLLRFGSVITPALARMLGPESVREFEEVHHNLLAAGRTGTTEEVAKLVALLTRKDAEWFNGATIDFTGGLTQRLLDVVWNPDWQI